MKVDDRINQSALGAEEAGPAEHNLERHLQVGKSGFYFGTFYFGTSKR